MAVVSSFEESSIIVPLRFVFLPLGLGSASECGKTEPLF